MDMNDLVKKTAQSLREAHVDLKSIRGFEGAKAAAPKIVAKVNDLKELLNLDGDNAKDLAVGLILELIPLPGWFSTLPAWIQKWFLGKIVEAAYQAFKAAQEKLSK